MFQESGCNIKAIFELYGINSKYKTGSSPKYLNKFKQIKTKFHLKSKRKGMIKGQRGDKMVQF